MSPIRITLSVVTASARPSAIASAHLEYVSKVMVSPSGAASLKLSIDVEPSTEQVVRSGVLRSSMLSMPFGLPDGTMMSCPAT